MVFYTAIVVQFRQVPTRDVSLWKTPNKKRMLFYTAIVVKFRQVPQVVGTCFFSVLTFSRFTPGLLQVQRLFT